MLQFQRLLHDLLQNVGPLPAPQSELTQRVYREQQQLVVEQSLTMGLINIINGLIAISPFLATTPLWQLLAWYVPVAAFGVLQIALWHRLSGKRPPSRVSGRFLKRVEHTCIAMGALWGAASLFLPTQDASLAALLTLVVIQCGMVTGVAALLTTLPRVVVRFSVVCVVLLVVGLMLRDEPATKTLVFPAVAYMAMLYAASLVSQKQLVRSQRAQITTNNTRKDLADAIESVGDGFAILDASGQLALANSRHKGWFGDEVEHLQIEDNEPKLMRDGSWIIPSAHPMSNGGQVLVHSDVTALKIRERELIDARREAEIADETKTRFLNTMSHELRTPLNVIIGFSRLLNQVHDRPLKDEDRAKYAGHIHQSAEHLLRLINDIIDYSKSSLDDFNLEAEPISTKRLIDHAVRLACEADQASEDVEVKVKVDPRVENIIVDDRSITRVLQALMSNAIKFRGRRHDIVLKASLNSSGQPMITIRDFGLGMAPDECERAFDAFYQGDSRLNRDFAGAGLGLTLARHLARLHGGEVVLRSRLNTGTAATLILPSSTLPTPAPASGSDGDAEFLDLTG